MGGWEGEGREGEGHGRGEGGAWEGKGCEREMGEEEGEERETINNLYIHTSLLYCLLSNNVG